MKHQQIDLPLSEHQALKTIFSFFPQELASRQYRASLLSFVKVFPKPLGVSSFLFEWGLGKKLSWPDFHLGIKIPNIAMFPSSLHPSQISPFLREKANWNQFSHFLQKEWIKKLDQDIRLSWISYDVCRNIIPLPNFYLNLSTQADPEKTLFTIHETLPKTAFFSSDILKEKWAAFLAKYESTGGFKITYFGWMFAREIPSMRIIFSGSKLAHQSILERDLGSLPKKEKFLKLTASLMPYAERTALQFDLYQQSILSIELFIASSSLQEKKQKYTEIFECLQKHGVISLGKQNFSPFASVLGGCEILAEDFGTLHTFVRQISHIKLIYHLSKPIQVKIYLSIEYQHRPSTDSIAVWA